MRHKTRRTLLSQCILFSLTAFSGYVLADSSTPCSGSDITSTCGLNKSTVMNAQDGTYNYSQGKGTTTATMSEATSGNIYMDGQRTGSDTQSLTVSGTDLSGHYIQGSAGGTANITLENGATADMIEAGGNATNLTINVDNSTLNGQQDSTHYDSTDKKDNDKYYMFGSSIYVAPGDAGNHIIAVNSSNLHGSIISAGAVAQSIALSNSIMDMGGIYTGSDVSDTTLSLTNSTLNASQSELSNDLNSVISRFPDSKVNTEEFDDLAIAAYSKTALNLNISDNSAITGDIALLNTGDAGNTAVNMANGSTVSGDLTIEGTSTNDITLANSTLNGNIDTSKSSGDTSIVLDNNARVNGNITTGAGNDTVALTNNSTVTGNVDGGAGTDTLSMDASSSVSGEISNFETVNTTSNNNINIDQLSNNTDWNIQNGSNLTAETTGSNVMVDMTSDSQVNFGEVDGTNNNLVLTSVSPSTTNQQNEQIATFSTSGNPENAVDAQFSNGKQQVESRTGAYNYNDSLNVEKAEQPQSAGLTASSGETAYNVLLNSSRGELASDVQGAIAGLDAAKQAGRMVTDDLANRLDQLHLQSLYGHTADGAQVWGDFLYQNGNFSDDVDYKDITQGVQGGVDWTSHLANGDSLTGGVALAWTRSRDQSDNGGANNFTDTVYGNYYSVYGGWQQALHDNLWGMFVDGSFSYGDMRYNMSANNVKDNTSGMTEALSGSADGNLYTTQVRSGVNVLLPKDTVLQPYATLGWDKADENSFSDQEITFDHNQVSEWNTSVGMRITTKLADLNKHVELYPWADARYQTEFSDDTDFKAADYHNTDGHNTSMGIFGAGINATIGKDLSFNTGVYFGTGDVDNNASVQAGVSYHF